MAKELKPKELRRTINLKELGGEIAAGEIIGQERVKRTLKLLEIPDKHYHIFVAGPPGTGKTKQVLAELKKIAPTKPTPPDICYVHNPKKPEDPKCLLLPPGTGVKFKEELSQCLKKIQERTANILNSAQWRLTADTAGKYDLKLLLKTLEKSKELKECRKKGIDIEFDTLWNFNILLTNNKGAESIKIAEDEINADKGNLLKARGGLQQKETSDGEYTQYLKYLENKYFGRFDEVFERVADIYRKYIYLAREQTVKKLLPLVESIIKTNIVKETLEAVRQPYPNANSFIDDIESFICQYLEIFIKNNGATVLSNSIQLEFLPNADVNVIIDNSETRGAPIIVQTNPTCQRLLGYIKLVETKEGFIQPTFLDIRAGDVHKANGGYLVIDALNLLRQNLGGAVWEALLSALKNEKSVIANIGEFLGFKNLSLNPEPVPLETKVILAGPKWLYSLLAQYDPRFASLFIKAEVEQESKLTPKLQEQIASHLKKYANDKSLKPLTPEALARVLEYGLEMAESQEKIDMRLGELEKLILEANNRTDRTYQINAKDVEKALEEREFRNNLIEERYFELIEKKRLQIDVSGKKIGEGNGLVVMCHDNHTFAYAEKVTCNVFAGKGKITFIDKKAKYTGKMFNKAAAIITSWLKERYAKKKALRLSAEICFEQSYYDTDGPSASIIKAAVLVSAISEIPMRQDCAATGTMNQKGVIGPIGGVNYKSRGFYKTCLKRGKLIGTQGVIIPKVNADDNLMLHEKIVESVKKGKFHIYPVKKIEEALEILLDTDMKTIDKAMNRALNRKK